MIHSMMMCSGPVLALDPDTTILPVVPMFHANAWGLVYAGPFCGTKLVFPGFKLDGASIYELLDKRLSEAPYIAGSEVTVADILLAFGRGVIVMVKETIAVLAGGLILFCLVVAAMMVDIPFGRQVLLASIILSLALLARRIGRWLGGSR